MPEFEKPLESCILRVPWRFKGKIVEATAPNSGKKPEKGALFWCDIAFGILTLQKTELDKILG